MKVTRGELPFLHSLFKPNVGDEDPVRLPGELGETIIPTVDVLGGEMWNHMEFGSGGTLIDAGPPRVERWARSDPVAREGIVIMPYFSVEHTDGVGNHTLWVGIRGPGENIPVSIPISVPANTPVGITRTLILGRQIRPIGVAVDGVGAGALVLRFAFFDMPVGEYMNMIRV